MKQHKTTLKRSIAILMTLAMVLSLPTGITTSRQAQAADYGLNNPTTDSNGVTTWDCVYFGNYWQNDTNGDGVADVVLEDLDGDGKIDSVSTDVAAETEAKTPADAPVAEAPAADEAPAAAVTTENPDLITTIPVEEASAEEAPEAASEAPDENN